MALRPGVVVPISADVSGLTRGITQAQSGLRKFGKVAALVAGAAAFGAVVKTLQIGTREFMEQQKVAAQTGAVLKSTGGIANVTAKQMNSLSTALMKKSGVDDEAIQSGQNLLLTFTKVRNETGKGNDVFNQATTAMLDLSVAMGKDLNSSAILVGKALNDPVKGAAALSRAGVQLTEGQKDQIKAFVESGRVLDAQKIILAELTTQFGGSAEAAGKTLPGQLNILKQTFNNLAGELAATFLPGIATAATKLVEFLNKFTGAPTLKAKAEIIIGGIVDAAGNAYRNLITWWTTTQRTELPARVIITPSGRAQFDEFFTGLERDARNAGRRVGETMIMALVGVFTSEGRARLVKSAQSFSEAFGGAGQFWFRVTGTTVIGEFIGGMLSAIPSIASKIGPALRDALLNALSDASKALPGPLRKAVEDAFASVRALPNKRNVITATVAAAVQDARKQLESFGANIVSFLSQKRSALLRVSGASGLGPNAGEITAEQRRIEDERFKIDEQAARDALATAEDKTSAQLDLDQLLLDRQQTLRERALRDAEDADKKTIDSLIASFNRGDESAKSFREKLTALIGTDYGTELGEGFAFAFEMELKSVLALVEDIAKVAGAPKLQAEKPGVSATLKAENQRRYEEALADWKKDQKRFAELQEKLKKREITQETFDNFVKNQNPNRPRPNRKAYGLALGGILKQPTFVAGEAGKEAVIPLESGSAMRILRDAIGGGGGSTQVINLTVNAGLGTNPEELSQIIVNSIKRYEKRNGSVFQGPLVTTAANASGVTSPTSSPTTYDRVRTLRSG